jgi:hypothetical protein
MVLNSKVWMSYFRVVRVIGAVRGWYITGCCSYMDWDPKKKDYADRPLHVAERLHVAVLAGILTPFVWPYYALKDYQRLAEVHARGSSADSQRRSRFDALALV